MKLRVALTRTSARSRTLTVTMTGVVALALAAAGCGTTAAVAPQGGASASALGTVPTPDGVQTVAPSPPPSLSGCDASLPPAGPLPAPGAMPAGSTMAKIVARGYLIAGVDEDSYLFGYRNPSPDPHAAPLIGFDIDFVREIARALFGSPDAVHYKILTKAERLTALQPGPNQVDLVADILTIDCQRAAQVSFSSDYFDAGQRILVDQSSTVRTIADLAGKRVCAASGTTSIQTLANPAYHVVPVSAVNWADCLVMLQQGQVAAISTTDLILLGMQVQDPYTKIVGPRITFERHGIGLPLHEDDMIAFVNAVLEQVRADGRWTRIYTQWVGDRLGPVPAPPPPVYQ
jgi:polar amino acid transport system substrate-binding protein